MAWLEASCARLQFLRVVPSVACCISGPHANGVTLHLHLSSGIPFDNLDIPFVDIVASRARLEEQTFLGELSMGWKWLSASSNGNGEDWTGFIDQGVFLEGTLTLKGTFRIDGRLKGNVISEQTVVLGENAKVEGQIEGNRVVISGRFDGVVFAKGRVEIQAKGVVTGEVHAPCMVIDPGGIFDGRCHMLASSEAPAGVTIPIKAMSQAEV